VSSGIAERLAAVRERIAGAAQRAGRLPGEITLVGVSKRFPAEDVVTAVRAGLTCVGESYVQEALAKLPEVRAALEAEGLPSPRFEFIGRLQRNKARDAVRHFDRVQSVDRARLGAELERRAAAAERRLGVLLQVDVSGEAQKGGVAPDALPALLESAADWAHLTVEGLMTIPAAGGDPRAAFDRLRELAERLRTGPGGEGLRELSMGMSGDFETAIEAGATIVRVGTAIFGPRPT
jgi:pyridoxal phosphate enzyme (YggS family)